MRGFDVLKPITVLALSLMIATPASARAQDRSVTDFRWMGDMTCGGWRSAPADHNTLQKAVLLNWVLGLISGRSALREDNLLADVQVSSVAAWLDDYCSRNPLNTLVEGSYELEKALIARRRG